MMGQVVSMELETVGIERKTGLGKYVDEVDCIVDDDGKIVSIARDSYFEL
jgi:hypothetical protein